MQFGTNFLSLSELFSPGQLKRGVSRVVFPASDAHQFVGSAFRQRQADLHDLSRRRFFRPAYNCVVLGHGRRSQHGVPL